MKYRDSRTKLYYRKQIYSFVDRHLPEIKRENRRVIYLDSSEACETLFLLELGYSPQNLFPCNWEKANLAHIRMKLKKFHPSIANKVNCVCGDIFDVVSKLSGQCFQFDIYNFDLEGKWDNKLDKKVTSISKNTSLENKIFAMTLYGARETGHRCNIIRNSKEFWANRGMRDVLGWKNAAYRFTPPIYHICGLNAKLGLHNSELAIGLHCRYHPKTNGWTFSRYNSGRSPMGFVIAKMVKPQSTTCMSNGLIPSEDRKNFLMNSAYEWTHVLNPPCNLDNWCITYRNFLFDAEKFLRSDGSIHDVLEKARMISIKRYGNFLNFACEQIKERKSFVEALNLFKQKFGDPFDNSFISFQHILSKPIKSTIDQSQWVLQ